MVKGYFLIITCCCTRAVHIESTPDLSVKSFLLAFRRFILRCGIPENIISDNFKTFKAVEVQELNGILSWKSPHGGVDFMRGWYVQLRTP